MLAECEMSHSHSHNSCCQSAPPSSTLQSLEEMEFERGIWGAAREGENERLVSLLDKGVEPSSRDSSGYTALHYAARAGHGDTVRVGSSLLSGLNTGLEH